MPFFIPLIAGVGGFVLRRWVLVTGVGLVAMYYDEAGELIGDAIGEEANEIMEEQLANLDITLRNVAGDVANSTLYVVGHLGEAIISGLDNGFDAIAAKLSGKESAVISGMTVAVIGILTLVFLFNAAKSGKV